MKRSLDPEEFPPAKLLRETQRSSSSTLDSDPLDALPYECLISILEWMTPKDLESVSSLIADVDHGIHAYFWI